MRFSIITCTYNSEKYLEECINSVKNQSFKDYEHIFVDGFSKDKTLEIINGYKKGNVNIKLIKKSPKGISNAMNEGIKASNGEIIHILHSDDFYLNSNVLRDVDELFHKKKCRWLVGKPKEIVNGKLVSTRRHTIKKWFPKIMIPAGANIPHENIFLAKNMFKKYGLFDETFKNAMDFEYWLRIISHETPVFSDKSFAAFRYHSGSVSTSGSNNQREIQEVKRALDKNFGERPISHFIFKKLLSLTMLYTHIKRNIIRKSYRE